MSVLSVPSHKPFGSKQCTIVIGLKKRQCLNGIVIFIALLKLIDKLTRSDKKKNDRIV